MIKPLTIFISALALISCSSDDSGSDSDSSSGSSSSGTERATGSLELSDSYPSGLTVTAFPQEIDESPGTAASGIISTGLTQETSTVSGEFKHPKQSLAEADQMLKGTASSCYNEQEIGTIAQNINQTEVCFGFDYGIVSGVAIGVTDGGQVNNTVQSNNSSVDSLKTALSSMSGLQADSSGEACMVTVGRHLIRSTSNKLTAALGLLRGLICGAKKNGADDLSQGIIDLKTAAGTYLPQALTISSASLEVNTDGIYKSEIEYSTPNANSSKLVFYHKPSASGNDAYSGVLNFFEGEDNNGLSNFRSMSYSKSGTDYDSQNLKIEVRDVRYTSAAGVSDPFTTDGLLNPNSGVTQDDGNSKLSGVKYFAFDVNPSSYEGKISFWVNPGGSYMEAPRGFVYETVQNSDGTLAGCAWAGAQREGSIRKSIYDGTTIKPTGCYTPQISNGVCGTASDNQGDNVWKQCFAQGASTGVYKIDTSKTADAAGYSVLNTAPNDIPEITVTAASGLGDVK